MKTRKQIARFIEKQMSGKVNCDNKRAWHYGKCELRQLMDFIFDGPPISKAEEVFRPLRLRNSK